jgi:two-component system response regulator HydG
MSKILLVDDDPQALESTCKILEYSGYQVTTAIDGESALKLVRPCPSLGRTRVDFDLVVTDVRMPKLGGLEFLQALSLCRDSIPVILMTAYGRVEDAVWAMKLGAVDFLTKPFKRQALLSSVEAALDRSGKRLSQNLSDRSELVVPPPGDVGLLIGRSHKMQELKGMIAQVASTQASVLLSGESGTGKELVARCLHQQSPRAKSSLIAVNCAALPDQLMESELFGFERGAFTGAHMAKEGLFEAAHGGTLLLDEIGDLSFALQAKLLRVLQEQEVRRIGATSSRKIDVRVIAATHKDLKKSVIDGTFRQDLQYRLEVITIEVPALRDRIEDLGELSYYFMKISSRKHNRLVQGITQETMDILSSHSWPGNVRELSNVIERAVIFASGSEITPAELPPHLLSLGAPLRKAEPQSVIEIPLGTSLKDVEELLIRKTLEATSGDKNMTARLLGINSRTIYRKLDKRSDELE